MYGEPIILASESPRRASILESLHIPFVTIAPRIDESIYDHLDPDERVKALATDKAHKGRSLWLEQLDRQGGALRDELRPEAQMPELPRFVLGADTLVAFPTENGWITIGKPANEREAFDMLSMEEGKRQYVFSGLCLLDMAADLPFLALSVSEVQFSSMSPEDIKWYLSLDEWRALQAHTAFRGSVHALSKR